MRALPLHPGACGLLDDTAALDGLILTTDTIVESVHYLPHDPPGDVAWKLLAANLSDLAAKGATPEGILLNYPLSRSPAKAGVQSRREASNALPRAQSRGAGPRPSPGNEDEWNVAFLAGFDHALTHFACPLLGGDTVSLPPGAPRVISLTAIGRGSGAPTRSGARTGDALYVTGTIGDAGAGLRIARGETGPAALLAAYRRPQPRLAEGRALAPHVHAMMDVSDGLLLDATRMASASGLAVEIDLAAVPLSAEYRTYAGDDRPARIAAATAGDDYELLFAARADTRPRVPATCVGRFTDGSGLALTDAGAPVPLPVQLGFEHRP